MGKTGTLEDEMAVMAEETLFGEISMEELFGDRKEYTVLWPEEMRTEHYTGPLYGYYIENTGIFNIVQEQIRCTDSRVMQLGELKLSSENGEEGECTAPEMTEDGSAAGKFPWLEGSWEEDEVHFFAGGQEIFRMESYSLKKDILSRNQGILESDVMKGKTAVFAGCGSGGSFIALELARAGLGRFILCDDDIFGYHNICRHQCGVPDVGKRKVDAVKERILAINPDAEVHTFFAQIQKVNPYELEKLITRDSVLLCCADNRHAGYVCNEMSELYQIPMIAAGCGARAASGEVFWYKPGCQMPCYTCAYGEDHGVDYAGQAVRRAYYADETELEKADFQPGMGLDIDYVGLFVAKLAIDLLMEAEEGYRPRLKDQIGQCTLLFSYEVDQKINPLMYYFEKPLSWRSGLAKHKEGCPMCSSFAHAG